MKKIFSILFALVLLSLGLVTAAPMAAQITVLDHFKCYHAWGMNPIGEVVYLEDQFGAVEVVVEEAEFFCNPVEKRDDGVVTPILNEDLHLTLYSLDHGEEPQERIVKVENQFGTQQLVVSDPVLLGVPTQKEYPYPPVGLDHFLLYNVIEGQSVEVNLVLYDYNFEYYEDVWVLEPVYFANPVRKTDGGGVTEIENQEAHLVLYRIASNAYGSGEVWVYNQFGEQYLEVFFNEYNPALLAVPSEKEEQYTLTISSTAGGSVTTPGEGTFTYNAGTMVSLVATPSSGYGFVKWTALAGSFSSASAATTTFTMPAQDVTVTANFEEAEKYTLTMAASPIMGGTATDVTGASPYMEGEVVSIQAVAASGYQFVSWTAPAGSLANVYAASTTFTMPAQNVVVTARFTPVEGSKTQEVTDGTVDARDEADTEVEVAGTATVTVARYDENPGGGPPVASPDQPDWEPLGKYIDVYSPDTSEATELEIRLYYTDAELTAAGIDEESLRLFWWNGTAWVECSDSGVNTDSNYMWAKIRTSTIPSLADLQGTPWGGYGHPTETDGCFIATAAYGTDTAKELDILREFRDAVLLPNGLGAKLVSLYYQISPPVANFISQHDVLRTAVRVGFIDPIVKILNWSHDLWSERASQ